MFDLESITKHSSYFNFRSPGWVSDNDRDPAHPTNPQQQRPPQDDPDTTQGTYPMDSLHSPVLGESASTCAPPGRRDLSDSDSFFERSDVNDVRIGPEEADDETVDPPASLLYRDKNQFYQNLLVSSLLIMCSLFGFFFF